MAAMNCAFPIIIFGEQWNLGTFWEEWGFNRTQMTSRQWFRKDYGICEDTQLVYSFYSRVNRRLLGPHSLRVKGLLWLEHPTTWCWRNGLSGQATRGTGPIVDLVCSRVVLHAITPLDVFSFLHSPGLHNFLVSLF